MLERRRGRERREREQEEISGEKKRLLVYLKVLLHNVGLSILEQCDID